jgi:hypothetical protein
MTAGVHRLREYLTKSAGACVRARREFERRAACGKLFFGGGGCGLSSLCYPFAP